MPFIACAPTVNQKSHAVRGKLDAPKFNLSLSLYNFSIDALSY